MKIEKIFTGIEYELVKGDKDILISDIVVDSRKVVSGSLFVSIVGFSADGHDYIDEAIKAGAVAVVVSKDVNISKNVTVIKVNDTHKSLSKMFMNFLDYPNRKLKTIAITGTKGKTTTSFMIKKILETAGYSCGLIGTTGVYINDKFYKMVNTTAEVNDTLKYMKEMVDDGIEYCVMEVSSQALKYDRVNDILFDYGIFTNLTQDHIGENEHDSMEDYINSKAKLFSQCNYGIFNLDDSHFFDIVSQGDCDIFTYGYHEKADLRAVSMDLLRSDNFIGIDLELDGLVHGKFKISTPGKFSSYNGMSAILVCHLMGIEDKFIKKALKDFSVKGRVEAVKVSDKFTLLIDYAHNGVSTESILTTIREYNPKRIVTIFGCGGNRSRDRRYEMGEVAGRYSDFCVITEDNNRYEEFDDIAKDILVGIEKTDCKYEIIPDRKDAIKYAIKNAIEGDIIMLLGKGHEDYKEIKGVRYPFDERVVIKEILEEIKGR